MAGHDKAVSDFLLDRLGEWGIHRIFGYPGDGINGVMGALERAGDRFEFIQVAHEEVAALAACAHAKFTGEVGVCIATSGPGAIHLLNGLYDAKLDHQPVVAIVGQQARPSLGSHFQQEIDLLALFRDVAGAYVQMIVHPEQARHVIDRAVRIALAERTVTCIILPHDVQEAAAVPIPPHEHGRMHSSVGYQAPRVLPQNTDLARAAEVLNAGNRIAMLVGSGALGAGEEVRVVADTLGAGVAKALLGKAVLPDDLPFVTGTVGWLGTSASDRMMKECDTLLLVGTSFPYTEFLPEEGAARAVQIDLDARGMGLRYPTEVNLVGDSGETLRALLPMLRRKLAMQWRERIANLVDEYWRAAEEHAFAPAPPLNPQQVLWEMSSWLPDGAILTADCGSSTVWYARNVKLRSGMMASLSGSLATMGGAVPYALAAKFAHPDRPVLAVLGDGAMQMLGNAALITVAKYWRRWRDPRLVVLVLNNRDLNYVTWEQRVQDGFAKYQASQDLLDFPFARAAELLGLEGMRVDRPDDVGPAWARALTAERPIVFEAYVSAAVPALPPTLRPEQQENLATALAGDVDAESVVQQLVLQDVRGER